MTIIEGYASLFGTRDLNDDVVAKGAFAAGLMRSKLSVRMLYQHQAQTPIGVWDDIVEDTRGLYVRGRILDATPDGRMVAALVRAGAIDGLSIGFRTVKSRRGDGGVRVLTEVELWEISIVTFPMMPGARITAVFEAVENPQAA